MRIAAILVSCAIAACRRDVPICADESSTKKPAPHATAADELPVDLKPSLGSEGTVTILVSLEADGELTINGKSVKDATEIDAFAKKAVAEHPGVAATVRADAGVPYGRVIAMLDRLKRSGVAKIGLAVAAAPK